MAHPPAIELAPGVFRIPTVGAASTNSFAFVEDDGAVTLVDCGLERAPARIVAGLRAIGRHPGDVTRILLTHAHTDHAGGAADMAGRTGAPVVVHEADAPYVVIGRHPPADRSILAGRLMARVGGRFPPVAVGERRSDGQVLDVAGGLRIVATRGHTPGHVSLLNEPTRTLVTGDALFNLRALRYSPRPLCWDFRLNERTAHALGELGAAAAPSLRVLRESAGRLSRLADTVDPAGGVDDIVEELHLVERAVASLLGALALAAEPDLGGQDELLAAAAPVARDRASSADWTTTGVLR